MKDDEFAKEIDEFREKHKDDPVLSKIEILTQSDIMNVLNASYIAKRFFGRSKSWFSHKINHHLVNGVPVNFTKEETEVLRNALYTLSIELQDIADEMQ